MRIKKDQDNLIALNFLAISPKTFDVHYFKKTGLHESQGVQIAFDEADGYSKEISPSASNIQLTKNYLLHLLLQTAREREIDTIPPRSPKHKRIYFPVNSWAEGTETVWLEPYYLAKAEAFGFLIDFKFHVAPEYKAKIGTTVDRRILQLSGTLDSKGLANKAFYQFKYDKIESFIGEQLRALGNIEADGTIFTVSEKLSHLEADSLDIKTYQFANGRENASPFFGLQKNPPFAEPPQSTKFLFLFKETDRTYAVNLLKGLRGEWSPNTFSGIEKMFRVPFSNDYVRGKKVEKISDEVINEVIEEVLNDRKSGENTLPIVITQSRTTDADDKLYYRLKHAFIKNDIACQVVTKDLIVNSGALKYSLSNIALQMFAKAGGKPWIVKPAISECLIIGVGAKHKEKYIEDDSGQSQKVVEKFLAYSVLTDSSGLFKEIQVLSDAENEDEYHQHLIERLGVIISNASVDGYKDIVVHSPFRISKTKVWDEVFKTIPDDLYVTVLVINNDHKFFGYDLSKNALVPYESSFVQISRHEYLIWFEGLQYHNSVFSKRIGGPIYINFWHANDTQLLADQQYRRRLLQDCINLSGANWRGFKAKQLPVSIFYCQKIADFLKRFDDYGLEQIAVQNLRPWFL